MVACLSGPILPYGIVQPFAEQEDTAVCMVNHTWRDPGKADPQFIDASVLKGAPLLKEANGETFGTLSGIPLLPLPSQNDYPETPSHTCTSTPLSDIAGSYM